MALSDLLDHRESTELLDEFAKREIRRATLAVNV
jgi:hypothetical protein